MNVGFSDKQFEILTELGFSVKEDMDYEELITLSNEFEKMVISNTTQDDIQPDIVYFLEYLYDNKICPAIRLLKGHI